VTRIIVGVDGSPASVRALEFALREGAAHQLPVLVIAVHVVPESAPRWGVPTMTANPEDIERTRHGAQRLVDEVVARTDVPRRVDVTLRVEQGVPAEVLREDATPEDHLVVGSRGVRRVRAMFLGSVSHDLAQSAPCPVTIVRSRDDQVARSV
jgi:nucleotide-binding universal stress UspA family protein